MAELKASCQLVGVPIIDEQHKKIIDLSNGLIQAMIHGMGDDVVKDIITELKDYTRYHFETEEAYMREIGFPSYEKHCKTHRLLTVDVDDFATQVLQDERPSPKEVLDFINSWMVNHIMDIDIKIGEFARDEGKL